MKKEKKGKPKIFNHNKAENHRRKQVFEKNSS
jgi:hypothetical protein